VIGRGVFSADGSVAKRIRVLRALEAEISNGSPELYRAWLTSDVVAVLLSFRLRHL
jgi:hypothetical protein